MLIEEKVKAIELVFSNLEKEIASFQGWSGLHCKTGCGKCCYKSNIEASVLEFLPFALYVYKEGKAHEWLEKLAANLDPETCALLDANGPKGMCSHYIYRGMICRLFGYAARTNKYGNRELLTCNTIKTEQSEGYAIAARMIENKENIGNVPVANSYYMQLLSIDSDLAQEFFPINKAIKRAIESILHYHAYRS